MSTGCATLDASLLIVAVLCSPGGNETPTSCVIDEQANHSTTTAHITTYELEYIKISDQIEK